MARSSTRSKNCACWPNAGASTTTPFGHRPPAPEAWLASTVRWNPDHCFCFRFGDDAATTYSSIGLVLLGIAVGITRSAPDLAALRGFLEDFVEAVMEIMKVYSLWNSKWFLNLVVMASREEPRSADLLDFFECSL